MSKMLKKIDEDLANISSEFVKWRQYTQRIFIRVFQDNEVGLRVYAINFDGGVVLTHTNASILNIYTINYDEYNELVLSDIENSNYGVYNYYGDRTALTDLILEAIPIFNNYGSSIIQWLGDEDEIKKFFDENNIEYNEMKVSNEEDIHKRCLSFTTGKYFSQTISPYQMIRIEKTDNGIWIK